MIEVVNDILAYSISAGVVAMVGSHIHLHIKVSKLITKVTELLSLEERILGLAKRVDTLSESSAEMRRDIYDIQDQRQLPK